MARGGAAQQAIYRLSDTGLAVLGQLLAEWNAISESILRLTEGEK